MYVMATPLQLALTMLEFGQVKNLTQIATREGVDNGYDSRMVNLSTLAFDIVEAILENALPDPLTLIDLAVDPSALWKEQRNRLTISLLFSPSPLPKHPIVECRNTMRPTLQGRPSLPRQ